MTSTAFIFARGGSKGLPKKNIRLLGGKPLIGWSIEQALQTQSINRVIVSTDSDEIADIAIKFGAVIPFLRPQELAQDDTPEWLVWRHALNFLLESEGEMPEKLISIPTTSPLRLASDIDRCVDRYARGDVDAVITTSDSPRNPYFNMVKSGENDTVELVIPSKDGVIRRQDCPEVYDIATVAYVVSSNFIFNKNSLFEGRVGSINIPRDRAIDIDTLLDFEIAEALHIRRKN